VSQEWQPANRPAPTNWPPDPAPSAPAQQPAAPEPADADSADLWRTRADAGWRAAAVAANPPVKDRTRSGLPKRQPRAQLVPGGVSERPTTRTERDPEEIRGRLASYHTGVRRGRAASSGDSTLTTEVER
jgi:hypothetical protein